MDWQPISTAPKDGTEIDLWAMSHDGDYGRLPDCAWIERRGCLDWHTRSDTGWKSLDLYSFAPTHWMPIPPAPVSQS